MKSDDRFSIVNTLENETFNTRTIEIDENFESTIPKESHGFTNRFSVIYLWDVFGECVGIQTLGVCLGRIRYR